jgi:hypothetical protein
MKAQETRLKIFETKKRRLNLSGVPVTSTKILPWTSGVERSVRKLDSAVGAELLIRPM